MDNPPEWDKEQKELWMQAGFTDSPDFELSIGKPGNVGMWTAEYFEMGGIYGAYVFDRGGNIAKVVHNRLDPMTPEHFEAVDHALHAIKERLQVQPVPK